VKFFLFTMAGSVLMLAAIIYLYNRAQTFSYPAIVDMLASGRLAFTPGEQMLLFLAFFVAFAIKVPLFPLHTWLPDAHVEAPTAGSIMLASVMLKMGTFGILHYCVPLFPAAARSCAPWIAVLAIIGIVYGALVAMVQPNMKKLVAYSSVSHLGFVVLGIFSFTQLGMDGAVYQMLNHGITTGALFAIVGLLYERRHSLEIKDYGGVATAAPWLSTAFLVTTLASIGLPLLNNFVGEFLVLQGAAIANFKWAIWASLGVILSACYMLWLYQRVFYGEAGAEVRSHVPDLSLREWAAIVPLIVMMVWMGVYSQSFLPPVGKTTALVLEQSQINVPFRVGMPDRKVIFDAETQRRGEQTEPLKTFSSASLRLRVKTGFSSVEVAHAGDGSHRHGHASHGARPAASQALLERLWPSQPGCPGRGARRDRLCLRQRRSRVRRHDRGGRFCHVLSRAGDCGRHSHRPFVLPLSAPSGRRNQRVPRAAALLHRRAIDDGGVRQSDRRLHCPGDFLHLELRTHRLSPRRPAVQRSRLEVLPAGIFRHRVFPLRSGLDLRFHRHD
jgi:hypothetical protein